MGIALLRVCPTGEVAAPFPVQFGHRSLIGIGVEVDDDPNRGESRVPIGEAQEGVQVDVAIEGNPQVADLDACHRGVGGVTDCEAVAQRTEQLLNRVRRAVRTAEWGRFVGGDRREPSYRCLAAERTGPADLCGTTSFPPPTDVPGWRRRARPPRLG